MSTETPFKKTYIEIVEIHGDTARVLVPSWSLRRLTDVPLSSFPGKPEVRQSFWALTDMEGTQPGLTIKDIQPFR